MAGLIGCVVLAFSLPPSAVMGGGAVMVTGAGVFGLRKLAAKYSD
jgi:APA family basic amino acid/polyamine antiporter